MQFLLLKSLIMRRRGGFFVTLPAGCSYTSQIISELVA